MIYIPFTPDYDLCMKFLLGPILLSCALSVPGNERQKVPVPKPFLECTTDAECEMTVEL